MGKRITALRRQDPQLSQQEVFICFKDYDTDGCSAPMAAFRTLDEAMDFFDAPPAPRSLIWLEAFGPVWVAVNSEARIIRRVLATGEETESTTGKAV